MLTIHPATVSRLESDVGQIITYDELIKAATVPPGRHRVKAPH